MSMYHSRSFQFNRFAFTETSREAYGSLGNRTTIDRSGRCQRKQKGKPDPQAVHVGFVAKDHSEVDAFYKAALAAGGKSKKPPQARPEYYPGYYATWVLDPDGHDIEVVNKS